MADNTDFPAPNDAESTVMRPSNKDRSFVGFLQTVLQDLRFSYKLLTSNPKFMLVAILTLGLGMAVNATVFSWVDTVLLHPYRHSACS